MKKTWLLIIALILSVALGATACTGTVAGPVTSGEATVVNSQPVGLWASGEGKVMAAPDIATLRLGVEAEAKTVSAAQNQASEAMNKVVEALQSHGIAEKDIQTQRFSIYPVRRWIKAEDREETTGYRVSNMVTAKIRKIDDVGTIIDAVAEAGGDLTRIDSIGFTIDDPSPFYDEAREKAIKDAAAKANRMAKVAGIELGKIIYISESSDYLPTPRMYLGGGGELAAPAPAPPPISPGELEIRLTVEVVYALD